MVSNIRCDGVYDLRTLRHLISLGITSFSFDFSPTSSNFVPEHIFFNSLLPELSNNVEVFLHFENYNSIMITRLLDKLKESKFKNLNYYFDFKFIPKDNFNDLRYKFFTNYDQNFNFDIYQSSFLYGLSLDYVFLEKLNDESKLQNFVNNFYYKNSFLLNEKNKLICNFNSSDHHRADFLDYFEFNIFSFQINFKLEVCYRNVDLKLLTNKIVSIQSYFLHNKQNKSTIEKPSKGFQTILN